MLQVEGFGEEVVCRIFGRGGVFMEEEARIGYLLCETVGWCSASCGLGCERGCVGRRGVRIVVDGFLGGYLEVC